MKIRNKVTIHGIVQGVGFRPYIHKLVEELHLTGWIRNSNQGVEMEIEGEEVFVHRFIRNLKNGFPPLSRIEDIVIEPLNWFGYPDFKILKSKENHEQAMIFIPPDISVCDDCLRELNDPSDRRYQYPFINCTNCGPRFSIIENMPYDRENTTMKRFAMCPDCHSEYIDIHNRRYHAQPIACPICGPQIYLFEGNRRINVDNPIKEVKKRLKKGEIGAIKGLGGFHITGDARNTSAVLKIREIKKRDEKPFAVMAENCEQIRKFCFLSSFAKNYLLSKERPIVLLKKKNDYFLSTDVAPDNAYIGVMLPYTPLHFLLLQELDTVLVMTSANISDEPIIYQNKEAFRKLSRKVDFLLIHNRPIYNRCDDSVLKISNHQAIFIRRSRGYAPSPIVLNKKIRQILAMGAEEKNSICFTRDHYAFPSQHLGDLKNRDSFEAYQEAIDRLARIFQFQPEIIACDMHPDYLSTVYAEKFSKERELPLLKVQHHYAHIASCMAENKLAEKVIGIAFDGTGYGEDGKIWGGEFMIADLKSYQRIGHLKYQPMPGGEQAIHQPWRMAYSYLYSTFGQKIIHSNIRLIKSRSIKEFDLISQMIVKKINSPLTSSCGRLFDAVASFIGVRDEVNYEGQAAVALESLCKPTYQGNYHYSIDRTESGWIVSVEEMFRQIVQDMEENKNISRIATMFHNTIAEFILSMCIHIRDEYHLNLVVLSGGVFQNSFLLNQTLKKLNDYGFSIFIHQKMPPNDACIALGQAVIANERSVDGHLVVKGKTNHEVLSQILH